MLLPTNFFEEVAKELNFTLMERVMDMNKKEMTLAIPGLVQCEYGRLSGEDCDYKVTIERRKVTSASFFY